MQVFFSIILWVCLGLLTSYFAQQRGRNPTAWFFIGMFFGLLGLLLLFVLPKVSEETTSEEVELHVVPTSSLKATESETVLPPDYEKKPWYYLSQDRKQQGPIVFEYLKKLWVEGHLNSHTLVWCDGMQDWYKIEKLNLF